VANGLALFFFTIRLTGGAGPFAPFVPFGAAPGAGRAPLVVGLFMAVAVIVTMERCFNHSIDMSLEIGNEEACNKQMKYQVYFVARRSHGTGTGTRSGSGSRGVRAFVNTVWLRQ